MRIMPGFALMLVIAAHAAGDVTISGRVIDESGRPIAGLEVSVEDILMDASHCCGPFRIVATATDGSFRFDVPPSTYVVETIRPWRSPRCGKGRSSERHP